MIIQMSDKQYLKRHKTAPITKEANVVGIADYTKTKREENDIEKGLERMGVDLAALYGPLKQHPNKATNKPRKERNRPTWQDKQAKRERDRAIVKEALKKHDKKVKG